MKIFLNGYKGRMGAAILAECARLGVEVAGRCDLGDALDFAALKAADAAVDFSFHSATAALAAQCAQAGVPLVIGTTGHTDEERAQVAQYAAQIPMVWAGNYSVGVNVLNYLVSKAAQILKEGYDIEVVEMHHRHKKDAPSGTAQKLLEILQKERGLGREDVRHGRAGLVGERPAGEIGMHALRGGDVVGDHTVIFAGEGERVELSHKASSRAIFAQGAVRAAAWLAQKKGRIAPAIYGMDTVLGIQG